MVLKVRRGYREGVADTTIGPAPIRLESFRAELIDSVSSSPGEDHPFDSAGFSGSGGIAAGQLGGYNDFNNTPSGLYITVLQALGHGLEGPAADINALLARTNPSTPEIQIPVFWLELKDMPDMLRQVGRIARRIYFEKGHWRSLIRPGHINEDMAAANLAIQFGWKPFVSDVWKIVMFQDAVNKQRQRLSKLQTGRGLSRRANFGKQSVSIQSSAVATSDLGAFASTTVDHTLTVEVWGSARWKATPGVLPPQSDDALRRQLAGLSASAILINVWDALPWSWLIDWFAGIGDIINAGNRTIATPVSACIMRRRTHTAITKPVVIPQNPSNPYTLSAGQFHWWRHQRAVTSGFSQTAALPTLGASQLSILGSLAVLRAR